MSTRLQGHLRTLPLATPNLVAQQAFVRPTDYLVRRARPAAMYFFPMS